VSDIVGILLLQPWLRNMLADKLIGSNQFRMQMGASRLASSRSSRVPAMTGPDNPREGGNTIEGEFERKE
jgi:UPF0716 protein FxsA